MPAKPTDIRIDEVAFEYEDHGYRAPIKFGGVAVDRVTILNVRVLVRTVAGTIARGFGSMPLGNVWAYPSKLLKYDETIAAMKALAERLARITGELSRSRPSHRYQPRARTGLPEGGRRGQPRLEAGRPDPEAVHARGRQPVRRGDPRRLRQGARPATAIAPTARTS